MAFFALLWKARIIENYRLKYEKEKINSIILGDPQLERTLSQRWRHYSFDTKKRISRIFKKWYPDGSAVSNFFLYLMTDQTFPNFLLKSVMGFVGGIILTYLCFMFFVFQLAISLMHATIMSSIIGVLLTLGLAFSYRIRCLVFLLIPQFFSRVGRYTLTCYALVLILTGPATNTLKNSEVLSESMACSQEQIKTSVHQLNDLMKKPINAMKDSLKLMVDQLKTITAKVKETVIKLDRLVLSIVNVIQSSFSWLQSVADTCNAKLGTPYDRCCKSIQDGLSHCQKSFGPKVSPCNVAYVAQASCPSVKPFKAFCYATDFMDEAISASVKKKLRDFSEHLSEMFHVDVHIHHSYSYSSNSSRSASQVAAGIVTEIRNRADPLLTWLSWSSCVTSLFLLLIIFRAKYYQNMYETRSRFDNRYVTKELLQLDLKRQQQGKETVLPLNRREQAKYITTSSFRLVASEKVYLNRSAVFMAITTFKLLIHMVADYSLYWVLMTIRCHGRFQSDMMPGIPHSGAHVSGSGFVQKLFSSIVGILDVPLAFPASAPISCLPDPYPPDLRRYTQIGVLIFLLWFFALFEPYGLRLRHLIMGHYRPERAKARATWLYNHILRTRGSFMKFARRKLHREYKYSSEASLTFRQWITDHVPFQCVRSLFGLCPARQRCLLCGITSSCDEDSRLTKCQTLGCPGVFCMSCFSDIGELCTICLSPADYGDLSDVSLEKGSSDDSDSDAGLNEGRVNENTTLYSITESDRSVKSNRSRGDNRRWSFFTEATDPRGPLDTIALIYNEPTLFTNFFRNRFRNMKRNVKNRCRAKKLTLNWVAKLAHDNVSKDFLKEENHDCCSNSLSVKENGLYKGEMNRTKSIGVNTDRNSSVSLNWLVNRFTRRRIKQPRCKLKKFITEKKPNMRLSQRRIHRIKKHTNLPSSRKTLSIKTFNTYDLTLCRRNLKNIVRNKKYTTKDKIKGYKVLKGILKATRNFLKHNEVKTISNQNNDASNNSPIENREKNTPPDNANLNENKNKKKCIKANKPKKPRNQKDVKKVKTKNSHPKIAEFHKFFSNHWNNFKNSIIPGYTKNRSDIPIPKEKRNHKRRKKRKGGIELNEADIDKCFTRKDNKHTRNLRLSAFLAELEWTKRDFKEEDINEAKDSFLCAPAPITANRIVGMVHLRSLPFQWREATKKQSATRLFVSLSKQKVLAKRALDKFGHKVNTVPESPTSSLIQQMMNSFNDARCEGSFNRESSICISKRESVFRSFGLSKPSDILNTDMIFDNAEYGAVLAKELTEDKPSIPSNLAEKSSKLSSVPGKEIIVSYSSSEEIPRKGHCRCDLYEDLQRKWDHIKKSISEVPGTRNPFSMLKNFCSSLFGPSCNIDTCPNKCERKESDREKRTKKPPENSDCEDSDSDSCSNKSAGCQVSNLRDRETQLADEEEVEDTIRNSGRKRNKQKMNKGLQIEIRPEKAVQPGRCKDPDNCDAGVQYGEECGGKITKGVGSHLCLCDEGVQSAPHERCTCATQHGGLKLSNLKYRDRTLAIHELTTVSPVANKKTQRNGVEMSDKATHCTAREHFKIGKEVKSGVSTVNQKLSLESNVLLTCGRNVAQALKDELTDCTITDTSFSSISLRSDESKTDTTICSHATLNYHDPPRRRRYRIKVVTKANRSTLTDKTKVCDTGTDTNDWWSPMVERKPNGEILLEKKKKGLNVVEKEAKELRELKVLKELKEVKKRRKNCGMTTDVRNVSFRSSTQIIPSDLFPGKDIMSPSRYLLESQRYYNELFAYNYKLRPQVCNYVTQMPRSYEKEKSRSPVGSRRNHHRKMKRLDECYSPKRQLSPRKRKTESTRTSDSPRRKASHRHDRQSNNSVFLFVSENAFGKSKPRPFPAEFLFGASTSAFQIEGGWNEDGKGPSIWDVASHSEPSPIKDESTADVAADSYHKHKSDVTVAAELGLDFYRFSISWSRVLPNGFLDKVNQIGVDYYTKLIDDLIAKNIIPMVTMYHWDLPANLQKLGGWTNPAIVKWFTDYTKLLFEKFGEKVKYWVTINDPKNICVNGYGSGDQTPFVNISGIAEYMCVRNVLLAHAETYHIYDTEFRKLQRGFIGISIGFIWYEAASNSLDDRQAGIDAREFEWGLFAHPIFSKIGNFPPAVQNNVAIKSAEQGFPRSRLPALSPKEIALIKGSADFLGINAYTTKLAYRDASLEGMYPVPSFMDDMGAVLVKDSSWPQSQTSWLQEVPWGFFKLLMTIKVQYDNPPMYITENGWSNSGGLLDEDRIHYIRTYLNAVLDAVYEGCDIRGYSIWSLIDTFEWRNGYLDKFGLYEVDYSHPEKTRTPRKSAFIYKEMIRSKILDPDFEPEKFIVEVSKVDDTSQERR